MLSLILTAWVLKIQLTLNSLRGKEEISKGRKATELRKTGLQQNTLYKNTLLNIPEVVRPVGVFPVGAFGVPPRETSLLVSSFWSFGPCLGSSSEGFLATFTPREGAKVIFCDYSFFSEYFVEIHFFNGRQSIQGRCRTLERGPVSAKNGSTAEDDMILSLYRRKGMRRNLMMTNLPTRGILVSLKPTEEALRKGRNTERRNYES